MIWVERPCATWCGRECQNTWRCRFLGIGLDWSFPNTTLCSRCIYMKLIYNLPTSTDMGWKAQRSRRLSALSVRRESLCKCVITVS